MTGIGALLASMSMGILGEAYLKGTGCVMGAALGVFLVPLVEISGKVVNRVQRKLLVSGSGGAMRASVPYPEARILVQALRWGGVGAWGLLAYAAYSGGPAWFSATMAAVACAANFLAGYHNDPAAGI